MARVLVTGMSGAGKSTLLAELRRRGVTTVDTDDVGWHLADGTWDAPRMAALLASTPDVVVSGTADNQGHFYDSFEHVVLLSAPLDVLPERVRARTDNPYGRSPHEQDEITRYVATVEPLLRRGATLELDGRRPVAELADRVQRLPDRGRSQSMSDPDDEKADQQVGPDKPPKPEGGPEFVDADDEQPPGSVQREAQEPEAE